MLTDGRLVEEDALDGSETTSYVRISGQQVPVKSRARWNGDQLVLTYRFALRKETREPTRTLSLDRSGSLVSEEATAGPSGKTHHVGRYAASARVM